MQNTHSDSKQFNVHTSPKGMKRIMFIALMSLLILTGIALAGINSKNNNHQVHMALVDTANGAHTGIRPHKDISTLLSTSLTPLPESDLQGVFQYQERDRANQHDVDYYDIALEDHSFWFMEVESLDDGPTIVGVATGDSKSANGKFSASLTPFSFLKEDSTKNLKLTGTYTSSLINQVLGTDSFKSPEITFHSLPNYSFTKPASIAAIEGSWSGHIFNKETSTINIISNGLFTGTSAKGCAFSGTFVPRPNGVNIYNVTLTFGGVPCVYPNQTASGVSFTSPLDNGKNQFIAAVVLPSMKGAAAFYGIR